MEDFVFDWIVLTVPRPCVVNIETHEQINFANEDELTEWVVDLKKEFTNKKENKND